MTDTTICFVDNSIFARLPTVRTRRIRTTYPYERIHLTPTFLSHVRPKHIASNYGFGYLGKFAAHMVPTKCKHADSESTASARVGTRQE